MAPRASSRQPPNGEPNDHHPTNTDDGGSAHTQFIPDAEPRPGAGRKQWPIILIVIALAVVLLGLILHSSNANKVIQAQLEGIKQELQMTTAQEPQAVCLSCEKLMCAPNFDTSSDSLIKQLVIEVDDQGGKNCCAYTAQQKSALLEAVLRLEASPRPPTLSFNVSDFRLRPVSAHVRISSLHQHSDEVESPELMELDENSVPSGLEHHRNMRVSRYALTIVHPGLYYVYSSVQFKPKSGVHCQQFKNQTLFAATIERLVPRVQVSEDILKCVHSCCDDCDNPEVARFPVIKKSGIFSLERNDQLRVRVYGETLIDLLPESSFLGLVMLRGT